MADSVASSALAYLARGWSVVPIRPRDKRPVIAWQRYQQGPPDPTVVTDWFRRWPAANVAIVTGAVSGLVVVDVDPRHGGDESVAELEREHGVLPETVEATSGGGGRHLYFAHPGGIVANRVDVAPGIDLRGDGGLIVAPPSIHPSGNPYAWRPAHGPDDIALAPLPDWLLRHLGRRSGHSVAYWRDLVAVGVAEGRRNATIASLAGHLLWLGLDQAMIIELLLCWNRVRCRPPLDDAEVVRTVQSVGRSHRRGEHGPDDA